MKHERNATAVSVMVLRVVTIRVVPVRVDERRQSKKPKQCVFFNVWVAQIPKKNSRKHSAKGRKNQDSDKHKLTITSRHVGVSVNVNVNVNVGRDAKTEA